VAGVRNRKRASRNADPAATLLSVYDGTLQVGEIEDHGRRRVLAFAIGKRGRVKIGIFANRLEAMRAVSRSRG